MLVSCVWYRLMEREKRKTGMLKSGVELEDVVVSSLI